VADIDPVLATLGGLLIAAILVGIGDRIVTGDKDATPLHGTVELIGSLPRWSLALAAALLTVLVIAAATGRRRASEIP
jgi:hypothetical protein